MKIKNHKKYDINLKKKSKIGKQLQVTLIHAEHLSQNIKITVNYFRCLFIRQPSHRWA